jgi:glutamate--cysteine ligase
LSTQFQQRLDAIVNSGLASQLCNIQRGIEKESLRITPSGLLAKTPHPKALGSALTHPSITTDYSEALLEFITAVHSDIDSCLDELDDIHRYTYGQLDNELLWTSSMPCALEGDNNIPVAQYGSSNVARMKTIYRIGLGYRYGRLMQTIAGIHYNFSLPDTFLRAFQQQTGDCGRFEDFKTERYFGLIRNFRRFTWLPVYLFGASPAVCKSFLQNREHTLEPISEGTLGMPYGTSLRMGDLGYQSSAQEELDVSYNSLPKYVGSLLQALTSPHPDYTKINGKDKGDYRQLNNSVLQIENEFYSSIRPKRVSKPGETPLKALCERGVEYIEVRCLDVNPYLPVGIDAEQIRFLDLFLIYCFLEDSPAMDKAESKRVDNNLKKVVEQGRDPALLLNNNGQDTPFGTYAATLMDKLGKIARIMDAADQGSLYCDAIEAQRKKLANSKLTPSGQIMQHLSDTQEAYFRFALQNAMDRSEEFRKQPLDKHKTEHFRQLATESLAKQSEIEASDQLPLEEYLENYFAQYKTICREMADYD